MWKTANVLETEKEVRTILEATSAQYTPELQK